MRVIVLCVDVEKLFVEDEGCVVVLYVVRDFGVGDFFGVYVFVEGVGVGFEDE